MRYLPLGEIIQLHSRIIDSTGGVPGIRDLTLLKSAVAQPRVSFGGTDLYPTLRFRRKRQRWHSRLSATTRLSTETNESGTQRSRSCWSSMVTNWTRQ